MFDPHANHADRIVAGISGCGEILSISLSARLLASLQAVIGTP